MNFLAWRSICQYEEIVRPFNSRVIINFIRSFSERVRMEVAALGDISVKEVSADVRCEMSVSRQHHLTARRTNFEAVPSANSMSVIFNIF